MGLLMFFNGSLGSKANPALLNVTFPSQLAGCIPGCRHSFGSGASDGMSLGPLAKSYDNLSPL